MFFVFLNLKLIGCFNSVLAFDWILGECNRTQNDAIWVLIALFLTNQIAGNTIDFKMNVIKRKIGPVLSMQTLLNVRSFKRTRQRGIPIRIPRYLGFV